jgi:hypothetical protein
MRIVLTRIVGDPMAIAMTFDGHGDLMHVVGREGLIEAR